MAKKKKHKNDLAIDEFNLDRECVRQAELYYAAAVELATARKEWEYLKIALSVVEAERANHYRDTLEKPTVAAVEAAVAQDKQVRLAATAVADARHVLDMCQAKATALDHKKKALENLVFLHGQSYFAQPRTPDVSVRESMEENSMRKGGGLKPKKNK